MPVKKDSDNEDDEGEENDEPEEDDDSIQYSVQILMIILTKKMMLKMTA